jgi:UPF0176 protein
MMPPVPRASNRTEVQTFYHFTTLTADAVARIEHELEDLAKETGVSGLIILGEEGLNATMAGETQGLNRFVVKAAHLLSPSLEFLNIKTSFIEAGEKLPFMGFVVKVRKEIVTLGRPDIQPKEMRTTTHLSPKEWHRRIQDPNAVLIDTRNDYESAIGTFRNALRPDIEEFADFPEWVEKQVAQSAVDTEKETFIFCTGGIRCEKAIFAMEEKGFKNVFQLDGGILNYIEKFPRSKTTVAEDSPEAPANAAGTATEVASLWDGECFVFDNRVAVDGDGRASKKFTACPHCGQAAEHPIFCARCDSPAIICDPCFNEQSPQAACTCSKNCAHHWSVRPGQKGKPQLFMR